MILKFLEWLCVVLLGVWKSMVVVMLMEKDGFGWNLCNYIYYVYLVVELSCLNCNFDIVWSSFIFFYNNVIFGFFFV